MGRFLLFIVASVSISGIYYAGTHSSARGGTARAQASAEEVELARQAAQGGFEDGLSRLVEDVHYRTVSLDRGLGEGYGRYDLVVEDTPHGSVRIASRGVYHEGRYLVEAELLELLTMGAPLVVHGESVTGGLDAGARIDGRDHRVPVEGGALMAGPADPRPALGVTVPAVRDDLLAAWLGDPASLVGGSAVVPPPSRIDAIISDLLHDPATIVTDKLALKDETLGTPVAPVVVHVTDQAKLEKGAVGYGILIVDGDLTLKESRWEGLVVVRAEPHGDVRRIQLDKGAQVVGSLVLLGVEFLEESDGGSGFPGGHMDLDLFAGDGAPLERVYHKHEWDDEYDLTVLDFHEGPDIGEGFSDFIKDYRRPGEQLRVVFDNAFNSAGTYTIGGLTGRTEGGFDRVLPVSAMEPFVVSFDALCALRGTNPGNVRSDDATRDRAFTVRFYDGAKLVYAVSAYEHAKEIRDGDPRCGATGGGDGGGARVGDLYGEFDLEMKKETSLVYSEEALGRIGRTVAAIREDARAFPILIRSVPTVPVVAPVEDGPVSTDDGKFVICHLPGEKDDTKEVKLDKLAEHLGHGDLHGPCPGSYDD